MLVSICLLVSVTAPCGWCMPYLIQGCLSQNLQEAKNLSHSDQVMVRTASSLSSGTHSRDTDLGPAPGLEGSSSQGKRRCSYAVLQADSQGSPSSPSSTALLALMELSGSPAPPRGTGQRARFADSVTDNSPVSKRPSSLF